MYPSGSVQVSGSYTPVRTKYVSMSPCTRKIAGKYNSSGYWYVTSDSGDCPNSKSYGPDSEGFSGTLPASTVTDKTCDYYAPSSVGYTCTKSYTASYSANLSLPAVDTRSYTQNYQGTASKTYTNSSSRYSSWIRSGNYQYRYVYMPTNFWVEDKSV